MVQIKVVNRTQGADLTDKVSDYLRNTEALLVASPDGRKLSHESIRLKGRINEWVYHLNDTTLVMKLIPSAGTITFAFATAGKYSGTVFNDLRSILDQYQ